MKPIELALNPIDGYLISLTRDPENSWYVLEIGLPKTWVFDENNKISCEVTEEYEQGKIVKIFPKKNDVVVDDLINFVEIIIETNERIAEKEKQFTDKMQEMKGILEKEAKKFYQELDELKENSFKNVNDNFAKNLDKPKISKTPRKPRVAKVEITPVVTKIVTEETESIGLSKE